MKTVAMIYDRGAGLGGAIAHGCNVQNIHRATE